MYAVWCLVILLLISNNLAIDLYSLTSSKLCLFFPQVSLLSMKAFREVKVSAVTKSVC